MALCCRLFGHRWIVRRVVALDELGNDCDAVVRCLRCAAAAALFGSGTAWHWHPHGRRAAPALEAAAADAWALERRRAVQHAVAHEALRRARARQAAASEKRSEQAGHGDGAGVPGGNQGS